MQMVFIWVCFRLCLSETKTKNVLQ